MDWTSTALLALGATGLGGIVMLFLSWLKGRETIAKKTGADAHRFATEQQRQKTAAAIAERDRALRKRTAERTQAIEAETRERNERIRQKLRAQTSRPVNDSELESLIKLARARRDPMLGGDDGAAAKEPGDKE